MKLATGHVDLTGPVHIYVDFAAYAKLWQINSRLDREAGSRHDAAVVAGFQPIDVCAVSVNFLADVVSRAMGELVAVAGLVDHRTRGFAGTVLDHHRAKRDGVTDGVVALARARRGQDSGGESLGGDLVLDDHPSHRHLGRARRTPFHISDGDAAREVLAILPRTEKIERRTLLVALSYALYESARRLAIAHDAKIDDEIFASDITLTVTIPLVHLAAFRVALIEATAGTAVIEEM